VANIGKCRVQELEFELDPVALLGKFSLEGVDFVGAASRSQQSLDQRLPVRWAS
jgi:hypothetical protein